MPKISNPSVNIPAIPFVEQADAPATPPAGKRFLYTKSDGFYQINDAGVVSSIGGSYSYAAYLLQRTVVGAGGQASFDLTDISDEFDRIEIRIQGKVDSATDSIKIALNGDTTDANYVDAAHYAGTATGSSASSTRQVCDIGSSSANNVGGGTVYLDNYANSLLYKSIHSVSGSLSGGSDANAYVSQVMLTWKSTSAINHINLSPMVSGNFVEGTTCIILGWK